MVIEANREFDIIVFGATGYAGQYVIEELVHSTKANPKRWAIAGRNVEKLKESLKIVQGYFEESINIQDVPIIEADVKSAASLDSMCKRTKLLLNCVGPYALYGEPVVEACIQNGTHHVDISGEMKYLETVQAKYFDEARAKMIYIVGACGFDSIPGDYGLSLVKENFPGDLNSVEYFIEVGIGPSGRAYNIGTFNSAANGVGEHRRAATFDNLLKAKVFKKELPRNKYPLAWRKPALFYCRDVGAWSYKFTGPDERVLLRSQLFRYNYLNDRPVESHGYMTTSSFCAALGHAFFMMIFLIMSLCACGRNLLVKHPAFFTAGVFRKEGPTRQQVMEGSTKLTFIGKGWKNKLSNPDEEHDTPPDTTMKLTMTGPELCYPLTAMSMVQAGITILEEPENLPLEGGVLSPGVAFEKTSLRERMEKRGVTFKFETSAEPQTIRDIP